jgi:hypothetical protein
MFKALKFCLNLAPRGRSPADFLECQTEVVQTSGNMHKDNTNLIHLPIQVRSVLGIRSAVLGDEKDLFGRPHVL